MGTTIDLNELALFLRVADTGSFTRAARDLGVPTSTVSRAVARLEEKLDVRLLHRTTRRVALTAEGTTLVDSTALPLATIRDAAAELSDRRREPHGVLRITAPSDLAEPIVADAVAKYVGRYPDVRVEVELTSRVVDLVREGFDIALRAGKLEDSSLTARKVGDMDLELYASPTYLTRRGHPKSVAELPAHDLVLFRPRDGKAIWTLDGPDGQTKLEARGRIGGGDFNFILAAIRAGGGIGLLPSVVASYHSHGGGIVRVLPKHASRGGGALHLVYPSTRHIPAKVTAFRDLVFEGCAGTKAQTRTRRGAAAAAE
jgi:DNA-binding transcriptional LysR family regulator